MILKCDANIHLPESWVEEFPRFTAFLFEINGVSTGMVTIPGEALVELGWWIRNGKKMGGKKIIGSRHTSVGMGSNFVVGIFKQVRENSGKILIA